MRHKKLPSIKKNIKAFLNSEEGKLTKKNALKLGMTLGILGTMFGHTVGAHTSCWKHRSCHSSHSSCHSSHDSCHSSCCGVDNFYAQTSVNTDYESWCSSEKSGDFTGNRGGYGSNTYDYHLDHHPVGV